jgi:hypothetical protein
MKAVALLGGALLASACAPLRSDPLPEIGPPEYAHVVAKRDLNIRAGETRAERGAWALLSLNPAIIAGAMVGVEDEFGRSQLSEYDLTLVQGGRIATVQSRYVVQVGQCLVMRRPMQGGAVVIIAQEETRCAPQANAGSAQ